VGFLLHGLERRELGLLLEREIVALCRIEIVRRHLSVQLFPELLLSGISNKRDLATQEWVV
jgi:hypothetical protein